MKFTQQDFDEIDTLAKLTKKIDNINATYVNTVSDDIYKKQPFLLSILLGYHNDVTPLELEELMKIYFLIWEYFKDNKNIQTKKLTEQLFEDYHNRNIQMLRYIDSEDLDQQTIVYKQELQNLKSKALMTAILYRLNSRSGLIEMNSQTKGIILIGIKAFIECFETIVTDKMYGE